MNHARTATVAKPIDLRSRLALSPRTPPHPTPHTLDLDERRRELDRAALRYAVVADWFEGLKWSGDPGDRGQNAAYELFTFVEHELREAAKSLIAITPAVNANALRREVLDNARARLRRHQGDGPEPGAPRALIVQPPPPRGG